jgi:hypothetical protein
MTGRARGPATTELSAAVCLPPYGFGLSRVASSSEINSKLTVKPTTITTSGMLFPFFAGNAAISG